MKVTPPAARNHIGGVSLVLLSSIFYGMYGVWIRLMGNAFGPWIQAGFRCFLVALFLYVLGGPKTWKRFQLWRDRKWLLLLLITSCLNAAALYYATLKIGVGLATLLAYGGILLAMFVFGAIFSQERFTYTKIVATVIALIGLWLVFAPSAQTFSLLALTAAFASGIAAGLNVSVNQKLPYSAAQTAFLAWTVGAVSNFPIGIIRHEQIPPLLDKHWLYLLGFVAVSISASWLVTRGIKMIEVGVAGVIGLMEIVFGLIFGILFFHERPPFGAYIGALLIIIAAAVPYVQAMIRHKRTLADVLDVERVA